MLGDRERIVAQLDTDSSDIEARNRTLAAILNGAIRSGSAPYHSDGLTVIPLDNDGIFVKREVQQTGTGRVHDINISVNSLGVRGVQHRPGEYTQEFGLNAKSIGKYLIGTAERVGVDIVMEHGHQIKAR